jgi:hypothetical protein
MRIAGRECPAYRFFEIAAFIPAHPVRTGQARRGILQHFRKINITSFVEFVELLGFLEFVELTQ